MKTQPKPKTEKAKPVTICLHDIGTEDWRKFKAKCSTNGVFIKEVILEAVMKYIKNEPPKRG